MYKIVALRSPATDHTFSRAASRFCSGSGRIHATETGTKVTIRHRSRANNSLRIPPDQATEWRRRHSLYKPYKKSSQQKFLSISSLAIFRKYGEISTTTKKKKSWHLLSMKNLQIFFHWIIHGFGGKLREWLRTFTRGMYSVLKTKIGRKNIVT